MEYNNAFSEIVDRRSLSEAGLHDLPDLFRLAVREGWVRDERGAWLLKQFLATYSGSREDFTDLTGYEAAVNGRGIPDLDIMSQGIERARILSKRAYAFAKAALHRLTEIPNHPRGYAYISISSLEIEKRQVYTGSVTFVTLHHGEAPYLESIQDVTSAAVLAVDSTECTLPLT